MSSYGIVKAISEARKRVSNVARTEVGSWVYYVTGRDGVTRVSYPLEWKAALRMRKKAVAKLALVLMGVTDDAAYRQIESLGANTTLYNIVSRAYRSAGGDLRKYKS